jgi:hypothetical protein
MRRPLSVIVTLALIAGAISPVAAHARVREGTSGDVCPMMSHRPASTPCVGEPCPCHHGSDDSSVLPDGVRLGIPERTPAIAAPLSPWASQLTPTDSACAAGFPSSVFHPPHLRG